MGATPMGATPKSAQKAYEVKNFHEFTEVPNGEGNKRISLVSIVSTIFNSMTSLLTHTVAHSLRPSYRPKINHQPLKKFLSLAVS